MANKHNDGIIRVFSISGHGKGEVDHVSGLAKVAIRRHVSARGVVLDANDCAVFLQEKFGQADNPAYLIQEISVELLTEMRRAARLKSYPIMIKGSSRFQVMVFKKIYLRSEEETPTQRVRISFSRAHIVPSQQTEHQ